MINCPRCDTAVGSDDRFCEVCGNPLNNMPQASDPPTRPVGERRKICRCSPTVVVQGPGGCCRVCGLRVEAPLPDAPSLVLSIDADLAALSDRGRRSRRIGLVNQDAALVARLSDGAALMAVADGVSTSNHPEAASAAAVLALSAVLEATIGGESAGDAMRRAITAAQAAVLGVAVGDFDPSRDPPETTIAAALVRHDRATIGWVGDSRAYLVSGSAGRVLTRDDSWLTEIVESGAMSLAAARADRRAHVITQCLGVVGVPLAIHVAEVSVESGAWLVLCTDGLWNYLEDGTDLAGALTAGPQGADALARCRSLALIANEGGGHDNISVALLRVA